MAARNAAANGVQIDFREGDLLAPFAGARVDILVSNPPYIPAADIAGLQQEVRDHEPRMALDGGPDGLAPYRIMLEQLALLPAPPQIIGLSWAKGRLATLQLCLKRRDIGRKLSLYRTLPESSGMSWVFVLRNR